MKFPKINTRILFIITLIVIAAISRLFIKIPNFNPVAAVALFAGTYISKKTLAVIIPIVIMLLSDLILGFYNVYVMIAVYSSFILVVGTGFYIKKHINIGSIAGAGIIASIIFFLITNFTVWATGFGEYSMDFGGLIEAYIAGLPFFRNFVAGTLTFSLVLFGAYFLLQQAFPVLFKTEYQE